MTDRAVLLTGSIAYDTVLHHPKRFDESLRSDHLDHLNLTFYAPTMRRDFGGCAANIAYAMAKLGGRPVVWGALGADDAPYRERFAAWGMDMSGLVTLSDAFTSQCFITTDAAGNQLASFHPGAMDRAHEAPWPDVPEIALTAISPSGHDAMIAQAQTSLAHGVPYLFDPGQAVPLFTGDELRALALQASFAAFSDYEAAMIEEKTGLSPAALCREGVTVFHTHGSRGSTVWVPGASGIERWSVPAAKLRALPAGARPDPVGAGDAYRGGLLWALARGMEPIEAARIASVVGAMKVESRGTQDYPLSEPLMRERLEELPEAQRQG